MPRRHQTSFSGRGFPKEKKKKVKKKLILYTLEEFHLILPLKQINPIDRLRLLSQIFLSL
jgi:hypothetical protein